MYDLEEKAVLQGLIAEYLIRPSAPELACQYRDVYDHLATDEIGRDDLVSIRKAIQLLQPFFQGQPGMNDFLQIK